jgi:hypothetical protein
MISWFTRAQIGQATEAYSTTVTLALGEPHGEPRENDL